MTSNPDEGRQGPRMFQFVKETEIDFLGKRRWAFALSAVLVALGVVAAAQIFITGHANLGIEFTGGTSVTLDFASPVSIEEARSLLAQNGFPNAQITTAQGAGVHRLIIRVKEEATRELGVVETADRIEEVFTEAYPDNEITDRSSLSIGPAIGEELREKAIWAILYAIIGIILYIAFRFDFKFGLAATAAMFHDILAVIGIVWLKNFMVPTEFSLLVMTAVLTLAGYSLTDTVVVFDRIRENLKKRRRIPLLDLINGSINQVLSRTVVTSLTTLVVVVSILALGGEVLGDFAFALTMGILVGTYSSIFVASPLLYLWSGGRGKLLGGSAPGKGKSEAKSERVKSS